MSKEARILFIAVYLLVGLGIIMSYSASAIYADFTYHNPYYFLLRQTIFVCIGTAFLFAAAKAPVSFWKRSARPFILLAIAFLVMVFVPVVGRSAGGAQRWIRTGFFNFQPAEFAKIAVCIYLSDYLARKMKLIKRGGIGIFMPPLVLVGSICILTLLQPDLGSSAFIFLITAILFFIAGIQLRYVLGASFIFLPIFYFLVMRVPYRLSRVTAFLNPWDDPSGSGFQIIQSFLAFGLGGIKGVGLGQGTQKLFYLPSGHTDFILSVIGEELGLIGVTAVLLLYAAIFFAGIQMAEKAGHVFDRFLSYSLILLIVFQAAINVLVSTGLVPTKGLPLPFVSYGGTSVVMNLLAVGILISLSRVSGERRS
ncbi:MAG: putative lipid II flippase FtsW [Candidatus Omnitrophica bacterium]|nr:putative lipid II flippase FtsW [Candidatus Omnitrophota bacterium]